jgi:hypothetical protein
MTKKAAISPDNEIKELLADPKFRIKLHDYITEKSNILIGNTSEELFPLNVPQVEGEFIPRLERYEKLSSEMLSIMFLVGYWGTLDHVLSASIPAKQFSIQLGADTRTNVWTALRWYPAMLITYALGIGAIAAGNYKILYSLLRSSCISISHSSQGIPFVLAIEEGFGQARNLFKTLPVHERHLYPVSEYLFSLFKNKYSEVVFLGQDYESIFDYFEILYALQQSHEREKLVEGRFWGPIGRFGWKSSRGNMPNPFKDFCDEASRNKESWLPLKAGFFDGSYERFKKIEQYYFQRLQNM